MLFVAIGILVTGHRAAPAWPHHGRTTTLLAVGLVSVGILPQALQRPDSAHLLWVTCVPFPFLIPTTMEVVGRWRPRLDCAADLRGGRRRRPARDVLLHGPVHVPLLPAAHAGRPRPGAAGVPRRSATTATSTSATSGRSRACRPPSTSSTGSPSRAIACSSGPSDLRRTWYSDAFIYWLFPELEPATYFIEMDPGLANAEGSSLADDVMSADFVILTGLWDGWMEPNSSMDYGSDAPTRCCATTSASSATTPTARPCSTAAAADRGTHPSISCTGVRDAGLAGIRYSAAARCSGGRTVSRRRSGRGCRR